MLQLLLPAKCSPHIKRKSCVNKKLINEIAQTLEINTKHGDVKTTMKQLKKKLGNDTAKWARHKMMTKHKTLATTLRRRHRPSSPKSWKKNAREWLNSSDIAKVMHQYHKRFKDFKFMGVHPRDFAKLNIPDTRHVNKPDFKQWKSAGIRHLGAVFNMDNHDQPGSHWVACHISIDPSAKMYGIYYYDSAGRPPPIEISDWMAAIKEKVSLLPSVQGRDFEVRHNIERRQFKTTECGMFAIAFLTISMHGLHDFDAICAEMGYDDDLYKLRKVVFNH
jgi:hypothetical protein